MNFELNVSLPPDARFAETARELAIHAARQAGLGEKESQAFGSDVERAIRGYMESAEGSIPLTFRRVSGPVEVLVNGRTLTPQS
jgi:hypothetical protein